MKSREERKCQVRIISGTVYFIDIKPISSVIRRRKYKDGSWKDRVFRPFYFARFAGLFDVFPQMSSLNFCLAKLTMALKNIAMILNRCKDKKTFVIRDFPETCRFIIIKR